MKEKNMTDGICLITILNKYKTIQIERENNVHTT